jgi:hypothetical protein
MSSYLSSDQKKAFEDVMSNMHETFARSIYAYKESQKVIISTDVNFNYLYNNVKGVSNIVRKSQFKAIKARIQYMDRDNTTMYDGDVDAQIKAQSPVGEVRIKVDSEGNEYFKDAKRVEIDGRMFFKVSDVKKHGLFSPKFFTYYLKPA